MGKIGLRDEADKITATSSKKTKCSVFFRFSVDKGKMMRRRL
jgi:hypothetical protein